MALDEAALIARINGRVPPTAVLLGFRLLEASHERGVIRCSYEAKRDFCNPMGQVQGGFVAAMLDEAAAVAAIVKAGTRIVVPSLEFKVSFLASAKQGTLFAEGRCIKLGRRVAFMESDLFDPDGKLLARMSVTAMPTPMPDDALMVERSA